LLFNFGDFGSGGNFGNLFIASVVISVFGRSRITRSPDHPIAIVAFVILFEERKENLAQRQLHRRPDSNALLA
jgi:hypothetical protein